MSAIELEMRANIRPIGLLAVVVVALTTVAVAAVAHLALGLSWPVAFVLGAIVSPTDPTAVEAISRRLAVPRRLVSILEGESLVNDGMALTIYASAVTAVVAGSISVSEVAGSSGLSVVGGVAIGLALGWLIERVRKRIDSPPEELAVSLLSGYTAYLPAELLSLPGSWRRWRPAPTAEREALVRLRDENRIDSDVLRRVERDLDLEDNRLA
jgi:NhaP-type Na+/H+ or K+/H+ antiporter